MTGSDYLDFDEALKVGMKLIESKENPRLGLLIIVGINLGVRMENLLEFKFEDLRKETVDIIEGNNGKKRTLYINDNIRTALSLFQNEFNGFAFKSQKKTIYSQQQVNRLLKKYFKENISSHSLRKSFGRRVWENYGKSESILVYLCKLFQHTNVNFTRIYLGIAPKKEELDNIYLKLNVSKRIDGECFELPPSEVIIFMENTQNIGSMLGTKISYTIDNFSGILDVCEDNLPDNNKKGVYFLYDENSEIVYIGKSVNSIRSRLRYHLFVNNPSPYNDYQKERTLDMRKVVKYLAYSEIPVDYIDMVERFLINRKKPVNNLEFNYL